MIIAETPRLIIRRIEPLDACSLYEVFGNPEVMRFSDGVKSMQWVVDWAQQCATATGDIAPWAIEKKGTGEVIGYCGLHHYPDINGVPEIEIGYRLAHPAWGQGFATEAARAVKKHAFDEIGLSRLIALIDPENQASIRVVKKLGFRYEAEVLSGGYTHPDQVFACGVQSKEELPVRVDI